MQNHQGLPQLKLKQDVSTRWNSTYDMLRRILDVKEAVIATLAIKNNDLNRIKEEEWRQLENATKILWIFNEITNEISAEKTVTVSKILYFIRIMYAHLDGKYADIEHDVI